MSKSLGNIVEPTKVIQEVGADVLRLWVASTDYSSDVKVSYDILKQLAEVYKKIRNTMRFILSNLYDFNPTTDRLNYEQLSELDRYALHKLHDVVGQVHKSFDQYAFYRFYQLLQNYCVIDLSNIYFAVVKDILYIEHPNSPLRRSVQTVLWEVLQALIGMVTPVLSHLAEDAIQSMPEALRSHMPESALLGSFPVVMPEAHNPELANRWEEILKLRDVLNTELEGARTRKEIGRSQEAAATVYHPNADVRTYLTSHHDLFRQVLMVSELLISETALGTPEQITAHVKVATGEKCERCWGVFSSVGTHSVHSTLCERCVPIVEALL